MISHVYDSIDTTIQTDCPCKNLISIVSYRVTFIKVYCSPQSCRHKQIYLDKRRPHSRLGVMMICHYHPTPSQYIQFEPVSVQWLDAHLAPGRFVWFQNKWQTCRLYSMGGPNGTSGDGAACRVELGVVTLCLTCNCHAAKIVPGELRTCLGNGVRIVQYWT